MNAFIENLFKCSKSAVQFIEKQVEKNVYIKAFKNKTFNFNKINTDNQNLSDRKDINSIELKSSNLTNKENNGTAHIISYIKPTDTPYNIINWFRSNILTGENQYLNYIQNLNFSYFQNQPSINKEKNASTKYLSKTKVPEKKRDAKKKKDKKAKIEFPERPEPVCKRVKREIEESKKDNEKFMPLLFKKQENNLVKQLTNSDDINEVVDNVVNKKSIFDYGEECYICNLLKSGVNPGKPLPIDVILKSYDFNLNEKYFGIHLFNLKNHQEHNNWIGFDNNNNKMNQSNNLVNEKIFENSDMLHNWFYIFTKHIPLLSAKEAEKLVSFENLARRIVKVNNWVEENTVSFDDKCDCNIQD